MPELQIMFLIINKFIKKWVYIGKSVRGSWTCDTLYNEAVLVFKVTVISIFKGWLDHMTIYLHRGGCVFIAFCLSVWRITQKLLNRFPWNFVGGWDITQERPTKIWLRINRQIQLFLSKFQKTKYEQNISLRRRWRPKTELKWEGALDLNLEI